MNRPCHTGRHAPPARPRPVDAELTDDDLRELYAAPRRPWVRANMVATVDGAAAGESGRSGSINNDVDRRVFALLRDARRRRRGRAPARRGPRATGPPTGRSCWSAARGAGPRAAARRRAGAGAARDLRGRRGSRARPGRRSATSTCSCSAATASTWPGCAEELAGRGLVDLLCEGGPHLLRDLLDQGVLDELCQTVVPRLVGGTHPRILDGPPVDAALRLHVLLEHDGTLLGRWLVDPPGWAKS